MTDHASAEAAPMAKAAPPPKAEDRLVTTQHHAVIGGELPTWVNEGLADYFGESIFTSVEIQSVSGAS